MRAKYVHVIRICVAVLFWSRINSLGSIYNSQHRFSLDFIESFRYFSIRCVAVSSIAHSYPAQLTISTRTASCWDSIDDCDCYSPSRFSTNRVWVITASNHGTNALKLTAWFRQQIDWKSYVAASANWCKVEFSPQRYRDRSMIHAKHPCLNHPFTPVGYQSRSLLWYTYVSTSKRRAGRQNASYKIQASIFENHIKRLHIEIEDLHRRNEPWFWIIKDTVQATTPNPKPFSPAKVQSEVPSSFSL